jgi:uncharacterized membrane protein YvlD (DUF360 family)
MRTIAHLVRQLIRFLVVWFVDTISLLITAWVVSGITIYPVQGFSVFVSAKAAPLQLGIANLLIRPLILWLARPLGWIVIFLPSLSLTVWKRSMSAAGNC